MNKEVRPKIIFIEKLKKIEKEIEKAEAKLLALKVKRKHIERWIG